MAIVTLGPLITDARNKEGGTVFYRSRGGTATRAWKKTVNNKTPNQVAIRAQEKIVLKAWSGTLTQPQRDAWSNMARGISRRNKLSQPHIMLPHLLYASRNLYALNAGGSPILDAPTDVIVEGPGNIVASAVSGTQTVTLTPQVALPLGCGAIVYACTPTNPGHMNFKNLLRALHGTPSTPFTDTFDGSAPVPPWTAAYAYNATYWPEAAHTLSPLSSSSPEIIRANLAANDYTIQCDIAALGGAANGRTLVARLNPATGARYVLILNCASTIMAILYLSDWVGSSIAYFGVAYPPAMFPGYHTYNWTITGPNHVVKMDGNIIISAADSTLLSGDVGICNGFADYHYQNYSAAGPSTPPPAPGDISAAYTARFGPFTAGRRLSFALTYVNLTTGQATHQRTCSCLAT